MGVKAIRPLYLAKVNGNERVKFIYVPREVVKALGVEVGDIAEITVDAKTKSLTVRFLKPVKVE